MFMDEFPHEISIITRVVERSDSYPYTEETTETVVNVNGFMDTPSTSQSLQYHQMQLTLNRVLYVPYKVQPDRTDVVMYEGNEYEIIGDAEDQGGQHEVNSIPLKAVML